MEYCWIVALPRADIEHCIKIGTFGLSRSHIIKNVQEGDKIVCCATKEWKIVALGEVTKGYYLDDSDVFLRKGNFIDRFGFQADRLSASGEVDFKPLIPALQFIKRAEYWPVHFKAGICKITADDWKTICEKAGRI